MPTVVESACLADALANQLYTSLTSDAPVAPSIDLSDPQYSFTPDVTSDLYSDITPVTLEELTAESLGGAGVFDTLMRSVNLHIDREYKANRITGDEYAELYTELLSNVLNQSTSFLLQKDQAKWAAITTQMQARIAEIQATEAMVSLEKSKFEAQKAIFDMQNSGAQYALTKMNIALADAQYCLVKSQSRGEEYKVDSLYPVQLELLEEQVESERSKTMDTRTDGITAVTGSVGKQKDLYTQQIDSFIKDAKHKTAKMYLDGWTVSKTLDENLAAPNELDIPSVSSVLASIRAANGL